MTAESRTLASETTASGSPPPGEVSQNLLFRHHCRLALSTDSIPEFGKQFASQLDGQVGLILREEARWLPVAQDENHMLRPKHLRRSVPEHANTDEPRFSRLD